MNIDEQIRSAELRCKEEFERVERNARITTERVLRAFQGFRKNLNFFAGTPLRPKGRFGILPTRCAQKARARSLRTERC